MRILNSEENSLTQIKEEDIDIEDLTNYQEELSNVETNLKLMKKKNFDVNEESEKLIKINNELKANNLKMT